MVSARFHAGAQTLPGGYRKGQGVIPEPLSEGRATPPWLALGNTHQTGQGEQRDHIGGGGGGRYAAYAQTGLAKIPTSTRSTSNIDDKSHTLDISRRPPAEGALAVTGRHSTAHMVHGGDPPGDGMEVPGYNSKGNHQHKSNLPVRDHVDGGGSAYQHLPLRHSSDERCPPWI